MIIAVSDVHLGHYKSDVSAFRDFINNRVSKLTPEDDFVLLGDIFDFWRRKNVDVLLENEEVLTKILNLDAKVHYVVGNHDYHMLKIRERFPDKYCSFKGSGKYLRLENDKSKFFFTHGYELDIWANYEPFTIEEYEMISENLCRAENMGGDIISNIWALIEKILKRPRLHELVMEKPPEERKSLKRKKGILPYTVNHTDELKKFACSEVRNIFLGLESGEKLIFGHTHRPFVKGDTGNTGSWVKGLPAHNTYIEIDNGKMELKEWKNK